MPISRIHDDHTLIARPWCSLYRAGHPGSGEQFLVMSCTDSLSHDQALRLLRHELSVSAGGGVNGIVRARELTEIDGRTVLILDNFAGAPLTNFMHRFPDDMGAAVRTAHAIATALASVHKQKITHRTIDDRCVLLSGAEDAFDEDIRARFAFFNFSRAPGGGDTPAPDPLEYADCVSWEYMAPELTGLVDLPTDHRADLYSLGIVIYQMITGNVPYRSGSAADMMNWHVTRKPTPPGEINGSIPDVLNDIVMLLLEKDPQERYDNALSLSRDLEMCLDAMDSRGTTGDLGLKHTLVIRLNFPEKLYGREDEETILLQTFEAVSGGRNASTFISGHAGTGKTSLVKVLRDHISETGGMYAAGKAEQFAREKPYGALSGALATIFGRLLLLDDKALGQIRNEIIRDIGPGINQLYELVPQLKHIIYPLDASAETDPVSVENRFMAGLSGLLRITARTAGGLALFLDDLQWADRSTLKALNNIIKEEIPFLYVIGAYRDNEVEAHHPLISLIKEACSTERGLSMIKLDSLDLSHVSEIITDVLSESPTWIKPFAAYVHGKTGGNPFYAREFIADLYSRGCLDRIGGLWRWNEDLTAGIPPTENVLALLADMMGTLVSGERDLLKAASCIGNRFNGKFLDVIARASTGRTPALLCRLVNAGYLTSDGDDAYAFSHDRIQESAQKLLTRAEKKDLHRRIGLGMLHLHGEDNERLFEITDHLNMAGESAVDRPLLAELNLRAGEKAKSSIAYDAGAKYFKRALFLVRGIHAEDRCLIYEINKNLGECLYLNAKYTKAEKYLKEALRLAGDIEKKAEIYHTLSIMKMIETRYDEAIEIGLRGLELFGIEIDTNPVKLVELLKNEKRILDEYLKDLSVEKILNMPLAGDLDKFTYIQQMQILAGVFFHANNHAGFLYLSLRALRLILEHGMIASACSCLTTCAYLLIGHWEEYEPARILGEAGYVLSRKYGRQSGLAELQYGGLILFLKKHLRCSFEILRAAYDADVKNGEYLYAALALSHLHANNFCCGKEISTALAELDNDIPFLIRTRITIYCDNLMVLKAAFSDLAGRVSEDQSRERESEEDLVRDLTARKSYVSLIYHLACKTIILYLGDRYEEALPYYDDFQRYHREIIGWSFIITEFHFYHCLSVLAFLLDEGGSGEESYGDRLSDTRAKFSLWSSLCPENFLCRHLLIEAECSRMDGNFMRAMHMYDQAISSARENEFTQVEAVACERAALFWLALDKDDFAAIYLKRAYGQFAKWGAVKKLRHLRERYPTVLHEHTDLENLSGPDILALLEYFTELSRHIEATSLLGSLGEIVLRHSGADRFGLVIERADELYLIALHRATHGKGEQGTPLPLADAEQLLPVEMIRYSVRTGEPMVFYDSRTRDFFDSISYMKTNKPRSAVCIKTEADGCGMIWYLENNSISGAFSGTGKTTLNLLAKHAAICVRNVILIEERERTRDDAVFCFRHQNGMHVMPFDDIVYFSSHGRHTVMHTVEQTFEIARLIKDILGELPAERFARIHKQYIINLKHIRQIRKTRSGGYAVFMGDEDDTRLAIGRAYHSSMMKKLGCNKRASL